MALVNIIKENKMDRNSRHGGVEATYSVFTDTDGEKYIQIDTYGSRNREKRGKKSQSLQFGKEGLQNLKAILSEL